jgi:hypothetical protein
LATIDVYKEWLGIPEGPRPPDHYQLLRLVQFEDAVDKIRANYKKLNAHVRKYATGQYSVESQELLNELAKAMLCLTDLERKREYDTSLGRPVEEEQAGPKTMDVILLEQKKVSADQVKEAKAHAERTGLELRDSFVQLKMVEQDVAAQALAQELGIPYVDLADMVPEDAVLDQVPKQTVKQHSILPLFVDDDKLLVACVHQIDHELEDELRLRFNLPIRNVLATPHAISQAIGKYYAPGARSEPAAAKPEAPAKGEKPKKKAAATAKEKPKPKPAAPKSAEEKKQQKQIGIIVICWSFVLAYLLDNFVLTPGAFFDHWTIVLFLTIPPIGSLIAWQMFMKK